MVQADRECLGLQVRKKINLGAVYLTQESTSIIAGTGELRLEQGYHGGFRAVADHLDGIDETHVSLFTEEDYVKERSLLRWAWRKYSCVAEPAKLTRLAPAQPTVDEL